MIKHILPILWKQWKDTLRNKAVLIQYVMFPFMTIVMENTITIPGMPEHFFVNLFSVMYIGMAPLTSIAAIISEEKEKNTLRVLRMSNVKGFEYLIGNAIYIFVVCMLGSLAMGLAGGYKGVELCRFLLIALAGHLISTIIGAAIGVGSKNQMMATSLTIPLMMVLSFLPMLSMFSQTFKKIAKFTFTEQLYSMINELSTLQVKQETMFVVGGNLLLVFLVFAIAYRKAFRM